jgi:DNA-binding NarL/FixJ family response regulator
MDTKKLRIIIVDDNKSFREAAIKFLTNELNCEVVGEASNGLQFLELIKTMVCDVVLMDIQMPELDGITATKKWCLRNPYTKVIAVTMFTDKVYLVQLIEAGFKGCVFKTSFFSEIVKAINAVIHGKIYFEEDMPINQRDLC